MRVRQTCFFCLVGLIAVLVGCSKTYDPRYGKTIDILLSFEETRDKSQLIEAKKIMEGLTAEKQKPEYYNLLGRVYILLGSLNDEAKQQFNMAIKLDPKFAEAYFNLGIINQKEAQTVLEDPEADDQERAEAVKKLQQARDLYQKAVGLVKYQPEFVKALKDVEDIIDLYKPNGQAG